MTVTVTDICGGWFGARFQRNGQTALAAGSQDARAGRGHLEGKHGEEWRQTVKYRQTNAFAQHLHGVS